MGFPYYGNMNLTLSLDDELVKKARKIAVERDTTLTGMVRGYLEKLEDFDHDGQLILASRLGYRITSGFMHAYLGKIFDSPMAVFDEAMLKPETQDFAAYVEGIQHIVDSQRQVAQGYLEAIVPPSQGFGVSQVPQGVPRPVRCHRGGVTVNQPRFRLASRAKGENGGCPGARLHSAEPPSTPVRKEGEQVA